MECWTLRAKNENNLSEYAIAKRRGKFLRVHPLCYTLKITVSETDASILSQ